MNCTACDRKTASRLNSSTRPQGAIDMTDTKRLRQMIAHHLPNSWDHATRDLGATGTALGTWDDLPPQLQRLLNEAVHHTTTRLIQSGHLHETRPDD